MTPPVSIKHSMDFPPPARDPLRLALAVATLVQGVAIVLGGPAPGSAAESLPGFVLYLWGGGLAVTGAALLLAAVWRDVITGVAIEGFGCVVAFLSIAAYTVGAVAVLGRDAFVFPILTTVGYAVGCAFRAVQIMRDFRKAHHNLQDQVGPERASDDGGS